VVNSSYCLRTVQEKTNRLLTVFTVLIGVQYADVVLCIQKPRTRNPNDTLAIQVKETVEPDRAALKTHLTAAVLGMADLCRQPSPNIQQQIAAQPAQNLITWCESKAIEIKNTDVSKDMSSPDNLDATTNITKDNVPSVLSWTDKEEEERNKNIPESAWFEEKARPPVEYIDYTG